MKKRKLMSDDEIRDGLEDGSPDFDTSATYFNATFMKDGTYRCPPGYRYKKSLRGEHLCFKE